MPTSAYDPELYDQAYSDYTRDVEFYVGIATQAGGPVLELGAGTGRLSLALARAGFEVVAVDNSPAMLARLRAKLEEQPRSIQENVSVVEADMSAYVHNIAFGAVVLPFRVFLHNLDLSSQLRCLRACYAYVRPGGIVALDVFHPSLDSSMASQEPFSRVWRWTDDFECAAGGRILLSEATEYDVQSQRLTSWHRYERIGNDGHLARTFAQKLELAYLYPNDLHRLFVEAGFGKVVLHGDFEGGAVGDGGEEIVAQARRPE